MSRSEEMYKRAQQYIPGGVNSPVRAFKSVGGTPIFMEKAKGAYMVDVDGKRYIDYINSWGPMILGHCHPEVVEAVVRRVRDAMSFGAPTEAEIEMAALINEMVPNVDKVRLVNSGTEACMSAVRLARGVTGRNKILKFEGCYHGHADPFLVKAGSGVATFGIQEVPGVPAAVAADTLTAPFNDLEALERVLDEHGDELAAIILEPVAGNMGCVPPLPGYLAALRSACDRVGALLIFDEVMTGFRLAPGGAQELYGIEADLVTYGKVIGGGMPIGAFGGRGDVMDHIAPTGKVYQAGTLSGNPVAVAAGYATLKVLRDRPDIYGQVAEATRILHDEMLAIFTKKGIPVAINRLGSMISVHFGREKVQRFDDAGSCDLGQFNRFFHHMLDGGVYLPPSAFETWFISASIGGDELDRTLEVVGSFEG